MISAALHGDDDAIRERLVREVMRVDNIEWVEATQQVDTIRDTNQSGLLGVKFPYYVGITIGFVSAWGCLPLVFDLPTAEWFNTAYVTTEHPQPEDVETWLEVGAWTWNWMEPLLGTISFQLLALQCTCQMIYHYLVYEILGFVFRHLIYFFSYFFSFLFFSNSSHA